MTNEVKLYKKEGEEKKPFIHTVEEMNIFQMTKVLNIVRNILEVAATDKSVRGMIDGFVNYMEGDDSDAVAQEERDFRTTMLEGFQTLLTTLPEVTVELLSAMSGIKKDVIEQQKGLVIFDIFDAIVEVNDIEEFISRAKKSLDATKNRLNFLTFTRKENKA